MRILIVEANAEDGHRMKCVLSPIGCEIVLCPTVAEARQHLDRFGCPALILANLFLTDGVSLGILTQARRTCRSCVLALMTEDPILNFGELSMLAPDADFILFKPLADDLLLTFAAHQLYMPWCRAAQAEVGAVPNTINSP